MAIPLGLRIIPYLVTTVIYIVFRSEPSLKGVVIKCIPMVCLCAFVAEEMRTASSRPRDIKGNGVLTVSVRYHRAIICGLVLSGIGDAFLVYIDDRACFIGGLLFFALAHVAYNVAFGWRPLRAPLLLPCLVISCLAFSVIYSGVVAHKVALLTALYNSLITTMSWRALVRLETDPTWPNLAAFVGAFFFFVSDFVLATDKFSSAVPNAKTIVMTTYYTGQLGIALSVIDYGIDRKTE